CATCPQDCGKCLGAACTADVECAGTTRKAGGHDEGDDDDADDDDDRDHRSKRGGERHHGERRGHHRRSHPVGKCVDGVCCDSACEGECNACNTPGALGTCTLLGPTSVCRASRGSCDAPEYCSGSSPVCPPDSLAPSGTVCRASAGACDAAETCT